MSTYATVAEADVYNTGDALWDALSDPEKLIALEYGTKYMDKYYLCKFVDDDGVIVTGCPGPGACRGNPVVVIGAEMKESNAILALAHLTTPLWTVSPGKTAINSQSVNAGNGVTIGTSYSGAQATLTDPFAQVTMLLEGTCSLKANRPIGTARLART